MITTYKCVYCGLEGEDGKQISVHERTCSKNPFYIEVTVKTHILIDGKYCNPHCPYLKKSNSNYGPSPCCGLLNFVLDTERDGAATFYKRTDSCLKLTQKEIEP